MYFEWWLLSSNRNTNKIIVTGTKVLKVKKEEEENQQQIQFSEDTLLCTLSALWYKSVEETTKKPAIFVMLLIHFYGWCPPNARRKWIVSLSFVQMRFSWRMQIGDRRRNANVFFFKSILLSTRSLCVSSHRVAHRGCWLVQDFFVFAFSTRRNHGWHYLCLISWNNNG